MTPRLSPQAPSQFDPAMMAKMEDAFRQQQMAYWSNRQVTIARIIAAERARPKEDPAKVDKRVAEFLQERINHGSVDARYDLAKRYLDGRGVEIDENRARTLLNEAAAQGHADAGKLLAQLDAPRVEAPTPPTPAVAQPPAPEVAAPK
jgi:TPR repeat protein